MNLPICLYLVDFVHNLDGITTFIIILFFGMLVGSGFFWIVTNDSYSEEGHAQANTLMNKVLSKWWICCIAMIVNVTIPSQKTMYLMLGGYYLSSSNLPSKVSKALELKLDSVIADFTKEHDKKEEK